MFVADLQPITVVSELQIEAAMSQASEITMDVNRLVAALEPLLRKFVREELAELVKR